MRRAFSMLAQGAFLGAACLAGTSAADAAPSADAQALNRAAGLYHQARYDSARASLESLLGAEGWRRRDSLVMLQYLAMSHSRLGEDSSAVARFGGLLALDSLFRLPRNEEPGILKNFHAAREARAALARAAQAPGPAAVHAPDAPAPMAPAGPVPEPSPVAARAPAHHPPGPPRVSLALGALPLGGGWLLRERRAQGFTLALLQAGGLALSIYASERQSELRRGPEGLQAGRERNLAVRWQWVQAVSLSTAVGGYLFSIFASGGD